MVNFSRYLSPLIVFLSSTMAALSSPAANAATLDLRDLPLFLVEGVAPNVVLTMDDSGSMAWSYLPDGTSGRNLTEYTASHFNPMYYDPEVDYRPGLYADGTSIGNGERVGSSAYKPEADFSRAAMYVYELASGKRGNPYRTRNNLGNRYRVFRQINRNSASYRTNNSKAYYHKFDSTRNNCTNANARDRRACYRKVEVTYNSGPMRSRPEFGFVNSRDERTNFANWYQFYSNRMRAGKTVMSIAFSPQNISSSVRVARQSLNRRRGPKSGNPGGGTEAGNSYIQALKGVQRDYFYRWLFNIYPSGGTPLVESQRVAGEFYRNRGRNSPYTVNPGGPAPDNNDEISCRLNTHILVTDGVWNGSARTPSNFRRDHQAHNLPDGRRYSPTTRHIYGREQSTQMSLSDMSFHYWASDLRPDLEDNVPRYFPSLSGNAGVDYWNPANDPANWQHMVNYNVAFGLTGAVPLTEDVYEALLTGSAYTDLRGNQRRGWPSIANSSGRIDDLYHAALNSRGSFFSARKPQELINALVSIMNSLSARESSASSLDSNSGSISGGAALFQAKFSTTDWSGDLLARPVSTGEGGDSCNSQERGSVCDPVWDAGEVNQRTANSWNIKRVFTINPQKDFGERGLPFRWNSITAEQKNLLHNGDNRGAQRLSYLRGAMMAEQEQGGPFRNRADTDLGAIVHSSPEYVGNGFDASGSLTLILDDEIEGENKPRHRDYVCANPQFGADYKVSSCSSGTYNRKPVVYIGANDGMLHAFDASLNGANGGKRLMSFVPNAVYKDLWRLTRPTFVAGSYVDGDITSADVFYDNSWSTVLVTGMRTGGQGYFGLDVTDPSIFNAETNVNANKLALWEFGDRNSTSGVTEGQFGANGDKDMGYSFGEPVIVKSNYTGTGDGFPANNGRWVAIFGNGYNATEGDGSHSTSGDAVLFIVDVETGKLIKKFDTKAGTFAQPNGIATATAVYAHKNVDEDYTADYVYGGDLRGNVWKFDISSSDRNDWKIAFGTEAAPQPLFSATNPDGNRQPITGKVRVASHPANRGGVMVYFGTGKYIEEPDIHSTAVQSFYGVWDKDVCQVGAGTTSCADSSLYRRSKTHVLPSGLTRNNLLQQSITSEEETADLTARETSDHPITWRDGNDGHFGWFIDLVNGTNKQGERVVGRAALRGNTVVFSSLVPTADPCSTGAFGWIMALDRSNGGRPDTQPFDINGDGEIGENDFSSNGEITSGAKHDGVLSNPSFMSDVTNDKIAFSSDGETKVMTFENGFKRGRHRWQQKQ